MNNKYTVDYFIKKFEAIPANRWLIGSLGDKNDKACALGHCGENGGRLTDESYALRLLFRTNLNMTIINVNDYFYCKRKTPRGRVLTALRDIKRKQAE